MVSDKGSLLLVLVGYLPGTLREGSQMSTATNVRFGFILCSEAGSVYPGVEY